MMRLTAYLDQIPRPVGLIVSLLMIVAVGVGYYASGSTLAVSVFFLVPLAISTWAGGKWLGVVFAVLCALTWFGADLLDDVFSAAPTITLINEFLRLAMFVMFSLILSAFKTLLDHHKATAREDELTGIANRRAFFERAELEIARCKRTAQPFTIVFTDIDNFKAVNDQHGHLSGDRLLTLTAELMRKSIRAVDQVARLGGDEFVILLTETDAATAKAIMDRLKSDLQKMVATHDWSVSFSTGVFTFTKPPDSVNDMLLRADRLMYSVKQSGKDQIKQEQN